MTVVWYVMHWFYQVRYPNSSLSITKLSYFSLSWILKPKWNSIFISWFFLFSRFIIIFLNFSRELRNWRENSVPNLLVLHSMVCIFHYLSKVYSINYTMIVSLFFTSYIFRGFSENIKNRRLKKQILILFFSNHLPLVSIFGFSLWIVN